VKEKASATLQKTIPRLAAIERKQLQWRPLDIESLIGPEHPARALWDLTGQLDLTLYYNEIQAVEGVPGRSSTDPRLLICLWLYAYSKDLSSAREIARECEYEPGFNWLCGCKAPSYHVLSDFRSQNGAALDDLFAQTLGMLSAEGLISLECVTQDGTKIRANAGSNTFRRQPSLEEHLRQAEELVRRMKEQSQEEEKTSARKQAARERALQQRAACLKAAIEEVQKLQKRKKAGQPAQASTTDADAHFMHSTGGGLLPSYNAQLTTDAKHGLIVGLEVVTEANDSAQMAPALQRCLLQHGQYPQQIIADGDYTNHASVKEAAECGVDFYGSWPPPGEKPELDSRGRTAEFQTSTFQYNETEDSYRCPAGQTLVLHHIRQAHHGLRYRIYRAGAAVCAACPLKQVCAPANAKPAWLRSVSRPLETKAVLEFKAKMATEQARQIYRKRSQIAEFPHAWLKTRGGLQQFRCRGRFKVRLEALWAVVSYNLCRWFSIRRENLALKTA
jgi:transposase